MLDSYELSPVKGKNVEDVSVGLTVYASKESFETVAGKLMEDPVSQEYFSTFEPVAVQYAVSSKST